MATLNISGEALEGLIQRRQYFSSNQALIFIGTILVDEIIGLQYQLSNQRIPIYGYNSEYYSVLARGRTLVQGAFSLNYKDSAYLSGVLGEYKAHSILPDVSRQAMKGVSSYSLATSGANSPGPTNPGNMINLRSLAKYIGSGTLSKEKLDQIIKENKEEFWGKSDLKLEHPPTQILQREFELARRGLASSSRPMRPDQYAKFNIIVFHGPPNAPGSQHRVILDAEIVSVRQDIQMSGDPQTETYEFIAKNIDM